MFAIPFVSVGFVRSLVVRGIAIAAVLDIQIVRAQQEIEPEPYQRNLVCTYFGDEGGERTQGVWELKVGANEGRILIAGETTSNDFKNIFSPAATPAQEDHADPPTTSNPLIAQKADGYLAILSPDLQQVIYWTYLGGVGGDRAYFAMEDAEGNIWAGGFTESKTTFPFSANQYYWGPTSTNGPGTNATGMDVFVTKLDNQLHQVLDSTIIGGSDDESPRGTLWVAGDSVYVSGETMSLNFRTTQGPASTTSTVGVGKNDAFVVKLAQSNAALVWSRLIVGNGDDNAWANVRVDSSGKVFVGGCTSSSTITFDTVNDLISAPTNSLNGPADGFVAKLSSSGWIEAMYRIGGSGTDWVAFNDCLELDGQGRPVVIGITRSADFPIPTGCQPLSSVHSNNSGTTPPLSDSDTDCNDIWVAKLANDLSSVVYASYVNKMPGGSASAYYREEPAGLALAAGAIYISGETDSAGLPMTVDTAFDHTISAAVSPPNSLYHDAYLIKMIPGINSPSQWHYSTFFGGDTPSTGTTSEPGNRGRNVIIGTVGNNRDRVIFSGQSSMTDMPTTPNVIFPSLASSTDVKSGFIAVHNTN